MKLLERIIGGISSLACGDALGVLAVGYNTNELIKAYGSIPRTLVPPIPSSPIRTKWNFGEVTDDTYQTIVIAENLIRNGSINKEELVRSFIELPHRYAKANSSTGRLRNDPNPYKKRFSITSGAAMRISPIGFAFPLENESKIISEVLKATDITHNSKSSLAGAAAIAFAISSILNECKSDEVIEHAIKGAWLMREHGEEDGLPLVDQEIENACRVGYLNYREQILEEDIFGGLTVHAVPFSLALASTFWNAEEGIYKAVEMGGDSDTLASITGLLCGCYNPHSVPQHILSILSERQILQNVALGLMNIRCNNELNGDRNSA